jgi:peptidyl-dipeptidase A
MQQAEARLNELSIKVNRASWIEDNFITDDTQAMSADAQDEMTAVTTELV